MEEETRTPPVPQRKPKILPGVEDEEIRKFVEVHEKPVQHFYKDTKGNMTIGIGQMVPTVEKAKEMPLYLFNRETPLRPATETEVESAYRQAKSLPHGQGYTHRTFDPKKNPGMPNVRLRDEDQNDILFRTLHRSGQELADKFPRLESYPPPAQKALLDMQFNLGDGKFREKYIDGDGIEQRGWPNLFNAVRNRRWGAAAKESHRKDVHEDRNRAVYNLFIESGEEDR